MIDAHHAPLVQRERNALLAVVSTTAAVANSLPPGSPVRGFLEELERRLTEYRDDLRVGLEERPAVTKLALVPAGEED